MFYKALDTHWKDMSSQGGIVRGCSDWLLRNKYIDSIVCVINGKEPGEFIWGVTDNPNDLAKSVYKKMSPKNFLNTLSEDIKEKSLFIGIPCQIAKGFKYRITLICSGGMRGNSEKEVVDWRYGFKPNNYGILYKDGTIDNYYEVKVKKFTESCSNCNLPYDCDMVVGDLHNTPYNLVGTFNPLFDEYINTTRHKVFSESMFTLCKINS